MNDRELAEIIQRINEAGYSARRREGGTLYPLSIICEAHNRAGKHPSITFWVTFIVDNWYLASWGYRYWRVGSKHSIVDVCVAYLTNGVSIGQPPPDVLADFDLVEIAYDEFVKLGGPGGTDKP